MRNRRGGQPARAPLPPLPRVPSGCRTGPGACAASESAATAARPWRFRLGVPQRPADGPLVTQASATRKTRPRPEDAADSTAPSMPRSAVPPDHSRSWHESVRRRVLRGQSAPGLASAELASRAGAYAAKMRGLRHDWQRQRGGGAVGRHAQLGLPVGGGWARKAGIAAHPHLCACCAAVPARLCWFVCCACVCGLRP